MTLLFAGDRIGLVHVGDSRAYRLRRNAFDQITKDDSFVQSLVDEGRLAPEEVWTHPRRSVVLRSMSGRDLDPSLALLEARAGDRYLICSDGLSDVVHDPDLEQTLRSHPQPLTCVQRLVELGLRADGHDNISCVVADVVAGLSPGYDLPLVTGAAGHEGALVPPLG